MNRNSDGASNGEQPGVTNGHFDRWDVLAPMLEAYSPPAPETTTLADYTAWDAQTRHAFDKRRTRRIAYNLIVATPQLQELRLEARRALLLAQRHIGRTGILVSGPATMGKTTAAFFALLDAFHRHVNQYPDWKRDAHIPVVYIEVPPGCTPKAIMGRLLDYVGVAHHPRVTLEERTRMVVHHLQRGLTSLIVIDELHNLARLNNGHFASAQAIKNLLNALHAVPIYVGVNLEDTALTNGALGAQFAGRSPLVRLDALRYDSAEDRKLWAGVLHSFEEQLALLAHPPKTLFPHAQTLWELTRGSIGALSRLLTIGALELIQKVDPARETLTMRQLSSIKVDFATERDITYRRSE